MFGFLKRDPLKKLQKEFETTSKQALDAQRSGNIQLFAELTKKAEGIATEMDKLQADSSQ